MYHHQLTDELYLDGMFSQEETALWRNGRSVALVSPRILELGWTDEFVIVRSHPDPSHIPDSVRGPGIISGPLPDSLDATLIYKENLIKINGAWHLRYPHILTRTDTSAEYMVLPIWTIIDIKDDCEVHRTHYIEEFETKRRELQVPDTLSFFLDLQHMAKRGSGTHAHQP